MVLFVHTLGSSDDVGTTCFCSLDGKRRLKPLSIVAGSVGSSRSTGLMAPQICVQQYREDNSLVSCERDLRRSGYARTYGQAWRGKLQTFKILLVSRSSI